MIAKTPEEISALREGGRRLARHLQVLSELVTPGVTPKELEAKVQQMIKDDGDAPAFYNYKYASDKNVHPAALCVSVNDVIVHGPASENDTEIEEGDVVSLDLGIEHKSLFTDHAVTVIAGEKRDPEDEQMVRAAYEALEAGIAQARTGNATGDIGHAIEQVAKKYKLGYPKNLCGHGVGKTVHEEPQIPNFGKPGEGTKLQEGLVIAIEPMFTRGNGEVEVDAGRDGHSYRTKDGSRSAHAEHTVLVTKKGAEILTLS